MLTLNFGIQQGSILGPLIFNLYVADLHEHLDAECRQYADDTSIYTVASGQQIFHNLLHQCKLHWTLENWSDHSNLIMNPEKTKTILISTVQMSTVHSLKNVEINLTINGKTLES